MDECSRANGYMEEMKTSELTFLTGNDNANAESFKKLSTGIKFLLHSLACVLDRIEENSLIIFDEPENHIQPPLLCKFLYCIRKIASKFRSLILVATHSPVILQETLARNVIIVSRHGNNWNFRHPPIETYGENIGSITDEVFSLNTSVTNYQHTAEKLFAEFPPSRAVTPDPISYLEHIRQHTGLDLGNEIIAYLISQFIEKTEHWS